VKQSAGTLLYRVTPAGLEVLLVHPSGTYNRGKPWSIPKGIPEENESLEDAARRETREETGIEPGLLFSLGNVTYRKSRKEIHAFAGPAPATPPRCASWEIDAAEYLPLSKAREAIHPDQVPLLDRLEELWRQGALPDALARPARPER
jgi:predicted NUDIX family NTP pyrophosphohydrolase